MVSYHGHGLPSDRFTITERKMKSLCTIKHHGMKIWGEWRYSSAHSSSRYLMVSGPASRPDRLNTVHGAPGISSDRRLDGPDSVSGRTRVNRLSKKLHKTVH